MSPDGSGRPIVTGMVKVFLVDDHEVVRRGLIDLLSADPELEVIGEAGSVGEAQARIPALQPDVAVLEPMSRQGSLAPLIFAAIFAVGGAALLMFFIKIGFGH